ncbi:MAG: hypothetical protein OXR73_05465 [Myxococcales bacterium]|nr:hypothetical protein [Myxococcales bacterium]
MRQRRKTEVVELRAFRADGTLVEELEMSVEDYYEGVHDLIDKDEYRAAHGIAVIEGRVYDPAGKLDQEFLNRYSDSGAYAGGRTAFADGTVNEDW